jgi:hypothetical protein
VRVAVLVAAAIVFLGPASSLVDAGGAHAATTDENGGSSGGQLGSHGATSGGDSVQVVGERSTSPTGNSPRTEGETTVEASAWSPPPGIPPWVVPVERCVAQGEIAANCSGARPGAPAAPPPPEAPAGTPGITIRDVASFRPELATLSSEPNGWSVRGLHANVLASGGSSTRAGELFGIQAEVRFTPVAYSFDYGDGSAPLSTATSGATWAALGLAEFDPTPTSHAYESGGTFTVTLLVDYAAEYRVGGAGAFTPIPGPLAIPSAPITIVVADSAATALVDRDCTANPRGPGC